MSAHRLFVSLFAGAAILTSLADDADAQPTRARRARHLNPRTHDAVEQPARALATMRQESALEVALGYLRGQRDVLGLTAADLDDVRVLSQLVSEHSGVTHIYLRQRFNGIEVHGADININVTKDGRVLSGFGNSFVPSLAAAIRNQSPEIYFTDFIPMELDEMERLVQEKGVVQGVPPVSSVATPRRSSRMPQ